MALVDRLGSVFLMGLLCGCVGPMQASRVPQEISYLHYFSVKDVGGNPVAGALVQVEKLHWTKDDAARPSCTTNQYGRCEIFLTSRYDGVAINAMTELEARVSKPGLGEVVVRDGRGLGMLRESYYAGKESENVVLAPVLSSFTVNASVVNRQGLPIPGSRVTVFLDAYKETRECITGKDGMCAIDFDVTGSSLQGRPWLKVTAEADGMFSRFETKSLESGAGDVSVAITLAGPFDYLCDPLRQSGSRAVQSQVARWLVGLQTQAYLQSTSFSYGDVCTSVFKGKKYASIRLKHEVVYNSLRSNSYQIGTKIFDDVIRKMVQRMAGANATFSLDGYDIELEAASGDATKDYSDRKPLNFRFILPKVVVQKYTDKDITGQQLINQSVVLLNDERIDLHLQ